VDNDTYHWVYKWQFNLTLLHILDAGLLARRQYSEGPATGHHHTGFSWIHCVYKQMLRCFSTFQVATAWFSCSPPDLNFLDHYFICMYVYNNHCHQVTAHLQLNILLLSLLLKKKRPTWCWNLLSFISLLLGLLFINYHNDARSNINKILLLLLLFFALNVSHLILHCRWVVGCRCCPRRRGFENILPLTVLSTGHRSRQHVKN